MALHFKGEASSNNCKEGYAKRTESFHHTRRFTILQGYFQIRISSNNPMQLLAIGTDLSRTDGGKI